MNARFSAHVLPANWQICLSVGDGRRYLFLTVLASRIELGSLSLVTNRFLEVLFERHQECPEPLLNSKIPNFIGASIEYSVSRTVTSVTWRRRGSDESCQPVCSLGYLRQQRPREKEYCKTLGAHPCSQNVTSVSKR